MTTFLWIAALVVLANFALSLIRVAHGPTAIDRMMSAQLVGTGGVALLLLLSEVQDDPGVLDTALVLALLAAFAAVAFVKTRSLGGVGDPEVEE